MRTDEATFIERLKSLARIESPEIIREELADARPEDLADAFTRLPVEEGLAILQHLDEFQAASVLVELPTELARQYIVELPDSTLAHYLDILPMDDALDFREEIGPERFDVLLEIIPVEDAQEIRRLMEFPEDSVGRMMTEDFFEVLPDTLMEQVLADIRLAPEGKYEMVNDIYVVDEHRHLLGVFALRRAIRAQPEQLARDLMHTDVVTCNAREPAEDAARRMAKYGFYALPVLDHRGRMVGIFTGDDAQAVLREEETEDVLKLGGVTGDAEAYLSLSPWKLVLRRLPWLGILFVAEFFTGSVLRHYTGSAEEGGQTILAQLLVFIPLLIGAGGNSGSQVTTTITRALAVGEILPRDAMVVLRREFIVAVIIGLALGLGGYIRALMWKSGFEVSLVVGLALPMIVLWAATVGSVLPLAAKRMNIDPAVMSAPFITTFVDATGLIIFFEIARRVVSF